jgi:lipopolysaccharide/colanic/teichoic acid biosynthesis glycosyltransferase
VKRFFDIAVAFNALFAFLPILIVVALSIRIKLGTPILFIQNRPGLHGKVFKIIKFRTMLDAKNRGGNSSPDYKRMTRFGAFLRSRALECFKR